MRLRLLDLLRAAFGIDNATIEKVEIRENRKDFEAGATEFGVADRVSESLIQFDRQYEQECSIRNFEYVQKEHARNNTFS